MKFTLGALALAAAVVLALLIPKAFGDTPDPLACTGYPQPRVFLESQEWWIQNGDTMPMFGEGRHVHLGTCFPLQQQVSGTLELDAVVKLHNMPGTVNLVRVQVFDVGTFYGKLPAGGLKCDVMNCTFVVPVFINTSGLPDGEREIRMTANIPSDFVGKRMYETTRWHVFLHNGHPVVNGGEGASRSPGAGGWYQDVNYQNVFCGYSNSGYNLVTGGPLTAPFQLTCKFDRSTAYAELDPDVHNGNYGTFLLDHDNGGGTFTIPIDPTRLASGPHKIMLRTCATISTGTSCGVLVLPFTVA